MSSIGHVLVAGIALACGCAIPVVAAAPDEGRLNVLFIAIDDLRPEALASGSDLI